MRYIGAELGPAWQLREGARPLGARTAGRVSSSMQNHYNLLYREEEREMIPLCAGEGVAVIPWSPLARGLLGGTRSSLTDTDSSARAGSDMHARALYDTPSDWEVVEAVAAVAKARGVKMPTVALAWLLHKPAVTAPIVGVTKLDHLTICWQRPVSV